MKIGYRSTSKASQSLQLIAFHLGANVPTFFVFFCFTEMRIFRWLLSKGIAKRKSPYTKPSIIPQKTQKNQWEDIFFLLQQQILAGLWKKNLFARLRKKKKTFDKPSFANNVKKENWYFRLLAIKRKLYILGIHIQNIEIRLPRYFCGFSIGKFHIDSSEIYLAKNWQH